MTTVSYTHLDVYKRQLKSTREHYRKGREISDKIRNPETERLLSEVEKRLENRLTY